LVENRCVPIGAGDFLCCSARTMSGRKKPKTEGRRGRLKEINRRNWLKR
jgi:hypothetical protein